MSTSAVNTVLGPISPDELGVTLVHEHIVYGQPGWYGDSLAPYDREEIVNWEPTHIFRNIIPALEKRGVTAEQIETITKENPRRLLGGR